MKIIIANWKLNPSTLKKAVELAKLEDKDGVIIAPSIVHLGAVGEVLSNASLASQDVFWEINGAYTGEVSPNQLSDIGVTHVIIGHSERRKYIGETDAIINKKVMATLNAGLKVILCVGEDIEVRQKGIDAAKDFITNQIKADLKGVQRKDVKNIVIAYEPIWAIGTGASDIPEETAEISAYIKNLTGVSAVLYGGSVNSKNAQDFLSQKDIDGALIGGASLKPKEFQKIVERA